MVLLFGARSLPLLLLLVLVLLVTEGGDGSLLHTLASLPQALAPAFINFYEIHLNPEFNQPVDGVSDRAACAVFRI